MLGSFEQTGLWQRSLGQTATPELATHLAKLVSSYTTLRVRAASMTQQIASAIPSLTVHDVTHLDALWETADLIAGNDYPLNPMEGYVLGGAILLHDAALCFEAYAEGKEGLRRTVQWRDAHTIESERSHNDPEDVVSDRADFAALRALHAQQARELGTRSWPSKEQGEMFLIDDHDLRSRYGSLIGEIASSHHWPIEDVLSKLQGQYNAPGTFPLEWRVDPVKIACLLRCADAAHIDHRRAPDFLFALTRRQGISLNHWKAQNWLARVDIDQSDSSGTSAAVTSNRDFGLADVDAWWVAYDAICLADKELRASNQILMSRPQKEISPQFRVRRISGVTSPESMSEYVRANGWRPCSAKLHVGNVEKLVSGLGGEVLYGKAHKLDVALREIIQNARDAVVARKNVEKEFGGRIRIQIHKEADGACCIDISDDGLGMSERVLTGPFLDFGNSFWASTLVCEEFPGLASSGFKSIGRFGIGFYSVFMVAERVTVFTKRWDEGHDSMKTLMFDNGLTLRPTLSTQRSATLGAFSTRVSFKLKTDIGDPTIQKIERHRMGEEPILVEFSDYLAALVAGIDVLVEYRESNDGPYIQVHRPLAELTSPSDRIRWLEKISYSKYTNAKVEDKGANRLRFIKSADGSICGLAALSSHIAHGTDFMSVRCIGGLAVSVHGRSSANYIGYFDYEPETAKREASGGISAPFVHLQAWADEQVALLKAGNIPPIEWASATQSLCEMGIDPLEIAQFLIITKDVPAIIDLNVLTLLARTNGIAILKSSNLNIIESHSGITSYKEFSTIRPISNGSFLSLDLDETGQPKNANSLIGCVYRHASSHGLSVTTEIIDNVGQSIVGPIQALILRMS